MRKVALIILDGWGIAEKNEHNAIHVARTPYFDAIWDECPRTKLEASGEYVGLPHNQIGGSEVGHLTIGSGRIYLQDLPRIGKSLVERNLNEDTHSEVNFKKLIALGKKKPIHLIGQISPGGIHSHEDHLFSILEILLENNCQSPYIHFISDGRDMMPHEGVRSAHRLLRRVHEMNFGKVITLVGRYYAMDRDKNWNRTTKALELYTEGKGKAERDLVSAFEESYVEEVTDEFIKPTKLDSSFAGIPSGEPILLFNFRKDRMRQITEKLLDKTQSDTIFSLTQYSDKLPTIVLFQKKHLQGTISEILSKLNVRQLKATETEKGPHVTYFFNGGTDTVFNGENRSIEQSNRVTHDRIPKMKASEIAQNIVNAVEHDNPGFILVNFANPDMVGHTGVFNAVVEGVEEVDDQLRHIVTYLTSKGYICCVTADHGNADIMYDPKKNEVHTAHTLSPVPFIIVDPESKKSKENELVQKDGIGLSRIAGTVLELMGYKKEAVNFESLLR